MTNKISSIRVDIAKFGNDLGFVVDEADMDDSFMQADNGSQYVTLKTPVVFTGEFDKNGVEYTLQAVFIIRISDHRQVSCCGSKFADLCTHRDGIDFIKNQLTKISQNFADFCESGDDARGY